MIEFFLKHEKAVTYLLIIVSLIAGVMFFMESSNTTATGNAKVDAKKTVSTSSDKMSGNAKKMGNVGSVGGDLNL